MHACPVPTALAPAWIWLHFVGSCSALLLLANGPLAAKVGTVSRLQSLPGYDLELCRFMSIAFLRTATDCFLSRVCLLLQRLRHPSSFCKLALQILDLQAVQVRLIDEAKDRLKRSQKEAARSKAATKLPTTDAQARVRLQMEADRLERLARGPVSQGSVAQPLPNGGGITTARDLGIGADDGQQD